MPFCTQCGNQVTPADVFCGSCGSRQAGAGASAAPRQPPGAQKAEDVLDRLNPRTASILCYIPVVGWVACVIVLATERFRHDSTVRFHAFQGLYLFVVWLFIDWVAGPLFRHTDGLRQLSGLLHALVFIAWIWMLVKTSHNVKFSLPVLGELAEKSVSEQK